MKLKAGPPVHVKITDEDKGEVQAVFSTLDVIDKDGDVTEPGAFGNQKVRISAFNHTSWGNALPIGKGTITESGNEAVLDGQFFMGTQGGKDTFTTIKELDDLMEWSYGYDVLESSDGTFPRDDENGKSVRYLKSLKVHEVSPVILGAGMNTRTLAAKGLKDELEPDDLTTVKRLILRLKDRDQTDVELFQLLKTLEAVAAADDTNGIKLVDHLIWATKEMDVVITRVSEALASRRDNGKSLADATMAEAQKLMEQQTRLREALAIGPPEPEQPKAYAESIFRDAKALIALTGGRTDGS